MSYRVDLTIQYEDDEQYRDCICKVFQMAEYDDVQVSAGLESVFATTQSNHALMEIYVLAAGKMMSEDPEIGLVILLSYDYFATFHKCLTNEENIADLKKLLSV